MHAPMANVDKLLSAQQFDLALTVCQLVFDPSAAGKTGDIGRFWNFPPFKNIPRQTVEDMFMSYKAGKPRQDVTDWRNNPFQLHVIVRGRP